MTKNVSVGDGESVENEAVNAEYDDHVGRRSFMRRASGLFVLAAAAPMGGCLSTFQRLGLHEDGPPQQLSLWNKNTKEQLDVVYRVGSYYDPNGLAQVDYFMRDHHVDKMVSIDVRLLDFLYAMQQRLEMQQPIEILSAYRSPETNQRLRRRTSRAAKNSLHMWGKAVDIRFPGKSSHKARQTALDLQGGGVGHYRRSGYLHLDVGPVRTWS